MSVQDQAAQWLCDLDDAGDAERAQFAMWLKASPSHIQAFLEIEALWNDMGCVDTQRSIDIDELLQQHSAGSDAGNVVMLPSVHELSPQPERRRRWSRWHQIAAVLVLGVGALAGTWTVLSTQDTQTYATSIGEQRAVKLSDGSVIHMNADSRLEVRYSDSARHIRLLSGEALFTVERDPARPFRVSTPTSTVEALGTQFNVYNRASGTTVAVLEGVVKITPQLANDTMPQASGTSVEPNQNEAREGCAVRSAPASATDETCGLRLWAGETAHIASSGTVDKEAATNIEESIAWKQRRLVFRQDTLNDIAAEFNRYNRTQIRIEGDALRERRLIGTFDADDPESLILFLSSDPEVVIKKSGTEIVIGTSER